MSAALRGQVTDVAEAGLHDVPRAQIARDRLGLRRRLDDHQPLRVGGVRHSSPRCGRTCVKRNARLRAELRNAAPGGRPATRRSAPRYTHAVALPARSCDRVASAAAFVTLCRPPVTPTAGGITPRGAGSAYPAFTSANSPAAPRGRLTDELREARHTAQSHDAVCRARRPWDRRTPRSVPRRPERPRPRPSCQPPGDRWRFRPFRRFHPVRPRSRPPVRRADRGRRSAGPRPGVGPAVAVVVDPVLDLLTQVDRAGSKVEISGVAFFFGLPGGARARPRSIPRRACRAPWAPQRPGQPPGSSAYRSAKSRSRGLLGRPRSSSPVGQVGAARARRSR